MKILFIEDDDIKATTIIDFIQEDVFRDGQINIIRKKSWQSGLLEVMDNNDNYDLVLLDMSMPRYDFDVGDVNEEFETYAGWELLKEMKRIHIYLSTYIITSFDHFGHDQKSINYEKLDLILAKEFTDFYKGMIYFNSSLVDWKDKIKKILI